MYQISSQKFIWNLRGPKWIAEEVSLKLWLRDLHHGGQGKKERSFLTVHQSRDRRAVQALVVALLFWNVFDFCLGFTFSVLQDYHQCLWNKPQWESAKNCLSKPSGNFSCVSLLDHLQLESSEEPPCRERGPGGWTWRNTTSTWDIWCPRTTCSETGAT